MTTPIWVCPRCRGLGPDGVFLSHALAPDGSCPGCSHRHHRPANGLAVCLRGDDEAAIAMAGRAETWASASTASGATGAVPGAPTDGDAPWVEGALVWAATHHGWAASPPLAPRPWPWLTELEAEIPDVLRGPTLVLGGAAGGIVAQLPGQAAPHVVLDSSPFALALGRALATAEVLPHHHEPWQIATRPFAPPSEVRRGLANAAWLVADAHDPPFAAENFGLVVLVGVLDSVADPWLVLQQAEALVRPGGTVLIAAPWCDRADICPRSHWLSTLAAEHGYASPIDALVAGELIQERSLRPLWRRDRLPWLVRHHGRLSLQYDVDVLALRKQAG